MKIIDADKLHYKQVYIQTEKGLRPALVVFAKEIRKMPEIVRCKDCKWYEESKHSELRPNRFCYRLRNDNGVPVGYNWDSDDFCSYGERRDKRTASYYGDNKLIETIVIDERKE